MGFTTSIVFAVIAILIGVMFGIAQGSFWWGIGFVVLGVGLLIWTVRRRRSGR